jgi:ABC-2 type transport system ATP-binding protein
MPAIEVQELTKDYGRTRAVDGLTFQVAPGRVTGFLGPNGAGKSTTMRLVLGLDRPTAGAATVGGKPFAEFEDPLREVGALLDPHAAHGGRTARNHLRALAISNGIPSRRVDEVLEQTGIAAVAKRRVKTFSLGMRQRLGIAAALLGDPAVLMLDEPTNGLDPEGIIWVRELMRELAAEGRTVLVSSHLMSETAVTVDHLVILGRGKLLLDSPMQEFIDSRSTPRVRVRTTEPARLRTALAGHGLVLTANGDRSSTIDGARADAVGAIAAQEGIGILELSDEQVSLEQAYLDLTGGETEFAATAETEFAAEPVKEA